MLQRKCWAAAAAAVMSIGVPGASLAATLHVPGDFATIQACINAAVSGVDECVVAPGTYHETIDFLGKAVTLRSSGGAEVTTIDATGIGGSVVMCISGEGPDTILEGFEITAGTGTLLGGYRYGGGMYNYYSNPTVTTCRFSGNTSSVGGGMYNNYSSPTVTRCTFNGNTAGYGGGGMCNSNSNPIVTNCTFTKNTTDVGDFKYGGGMYNYFSNPTATNCTFSSNTAAYGGGGMYNENSSPTVTKCTFSANTARVSGGGMFNAGGNPTVTDSTFSANTAHFSGGMYNENSSPTVINCAFSGNTGSAMYNYDGSPKVTNCTFGANTAYFGGGMRNQNSNPTVINCAFSGNTANFGGGMVNSDSRPTVTNCTFSGNTASTGGGMYNSGGRLTVTNCVLWRDNPQELVNGSSVPTIRYSDVQGGLPVGAVDGGGNIAVDPVFMRLPNPGPDGTWDGVDDDYGDLRLQVGSPCIDAGDPGFVAQPGETDLEGHARVLCARVDMGAYEFGIGDYDCDQAVDLIDFANWSACTTGPLQSAIGNWQSAIPCEAFDFDGDADVDFRDFAAWQNAFTGE